MTSDIQHIIMNLIGPVVIVLQITIFRANCLIDLNLTENYFNEKSTKYGSVFGCFNKTEQIGLAKLLMSKTRLVSVLNINRKGVHEILKSKNQLIGMVLDGDCLRSEEFLIICGRLKFFDVKHHWLITTTSNNITRKFKDVVLNINADIHVAFPNATTQNWIIMDIYNAASAHGGVLNYSKIGYYNEKQGYNARNKEATYWIRKNMTGVIFKTIIVLPVPYEGTLNDYLNSDDNRDVNTFSRFHSKLLHFCRDYYNFTMEIEVLTVWGYPDPNGTFNGLVGELERKTIDFGSSPIFFREDRARVIDYGRNTWILRTGFVFRNPKARTSIEIYLKPLSASVWLITGFLATLSVILVKVVTTFERKKYRYRDETSWSLSVLFTLGALCQQGAPRTPIMTCGRITTISIFLLSVLVYQFYSASIVSYLLMKQPITIRTIKDLLESSLKVGCEDTIYIRDHLKHTTDEIVKRLYRKKILGKGNTSNFWPAAEGLDLVKKGGYAFHMDAATGYPIIETTFPMTAICELKEIELFRTKDLQYLHAIYQKESPFRDMLDTCFQRIAEHGILTRERQHWHPRKPECIQSASALTFNVGLDEFFPALLVLVMGIVSSLALLVVEKRIKIMQDKAHPPAFVSQEKLVLPFVK